MNECCIYLVEVSDYTLFVVFFYLTSLYTGIKIYIIRQSRLSNVCYVMCPLLLLILLAEHFFIQIAIHILLRKMTM